jgi:hypothetical protein
MDCAAEKAMKRIAFWVIVLSLIVMPFMIHGQTDNTFYVKQFPGSTVGQKATAAQAACNPNMPCIIVFDPSLSAYPAGTMPTQCSQCIWNDYRTAHPSLQLSNVNGYRYVGAGYSLSQAVSDAVVAGGGTVFIPTSQTLTSPLVVGTPTAAVALIMTGGASLTCQVASGTSCIELDNQSSISCSVVPSGHTCQINEAAGNNTTYLVAPAHTDGTQSSMALLGVTVQGRSGGSTDSLIDIHGLFDGTELSNVTLSCWENNGLRITAPNGPIHLSAISTLSGGCTNAGTPVIIEGTSSPNDNAAISWYGGTCGGSTNSTEPCIYINNVNTSQVLNFGIAIHGVYVEAGTSSTASGIEINGAGSVHLDSITFGGSQWTNGVQIDNSPEIQNVVLTNVSVLSTLTGALVNDIKNNYQLKQTYVSQWTFRSPQGSDDGPYHLFYQNSNNGNWGALTIDCLSGVFGAGSCYLGNWKKGTGTSPDIWIGAANGSTNFGFIMNGSKAWGFNSSLAFYPFGNSVQDLGQPGNYIKNVWANTYNDPNGHTAVMCSGTPSSGKYCDGGTETWTNLPVSPTFVAKSAHLGAASCSPAGGSYNTCTSVINWPSAFADTNYYVSCTGVNPTGSGSVALATYIASQSTSSVTVTVQSLTSGTSLQFSDIQCVGVHN